MGCQLCRNDLHDENEMSKDPNTNQLEFNNKKRRSVFNCGLNGLC